MSEKITYLALATAIVGLLVLTYASEAVHPPKALISRITQADVGRTVRIQGSVEDVHVFKGGSAIVTVADENASISVYLPYTVAQKTNATALKDKRIEVVGTVSVYEGRIELAVEGADKITPLL